MKKFIILLLFPFFALSQSNKKYIRVDYESDCCGRPSEEVILKFVKKFADQHSLKPFEVCYFSNGIEGELALFIGTDNLNRKNLKKFRELLEDIAHDQTDYSEKPIGGSVQIDKELTSKSYLKGIHEKLGSRFHILK